MGERDVFPESRQLLLVCYQHAKCSCFVYFVIQLRTENLEMKGNIRQKPDIIFSSKERARKLGTKKIFLLL